MAEAEIPVPTRQPTGQPMLDRMQEGLRALTEYLRGTRMALGVYTAQTADVTIAAAAYAPLLSVSITKRQVESRLAIRFGASFVQLTAAGGVSFQVKLDGVVVKGTYVTTTTVNAAYNACILLVTSAAAGPRTVSVEWKDSVSSARINAKTIVEEHATLFVEEVP